MKKAGLYVLLALMASVQAGSYDRYAYFVSMPFVPSFPHSQLECQNYRKEADARVMRIRVAHDACIDDQGTQSRNAAGEPPGSCSKKDCQQLHTARDERTAEVAKNADACVASVNAYREQQFQQKQEEHQRRVRDARTDPCERAWLKYESDCVGGADTEEGQKACNNRIQKLRFDCPAKPPF